MKNILSKILLISLAIIISLSIAELFVRFYLPQQLIYYNNDIWRPDSTFGWRIRKNVNTVVNTGGERLVHFRSDENGYRVNIDYDNEEDNEKGDEKDFSILFLGDSFLQATQVENEKTIPQVIKSEILSRHNLNITVYNTGVGGWNPNQYFLEAKKVLAERKIDLGIVLLFVNNDIVDTIQTSFSPRHAAQRHKLRIPDSLSFSSLKDSIFYPVNDFLEVRSHLFILFKARFSTSLSKVGLTPYYFPEIFYVNKSNSDQWAITTEICKNIYDEFKAYDTPVIFVLLPASFQVHEEIFADYIKGFNISVDSVDLEQPNKLLSKHFNENSMTLLDPLIFMRERTKDGDRFYGIIDLHFSEDGHQVVTDFILPEVERYIGNGE